MREMIFLGAGASADAGVPTAFKMTEHMLKLFESDYKLQKHCRILRYVVGGLLFQAGVRGNDPLNGVNVEDLFNAVQLLATRHDLEAAPFIGSWHTTLDDLDKIEVTARDGTDLRRALFAAALDDLKSGRHNTQDKSGEFDRSIENFIRSGLRAFGTRGPGKHVYDIFEDLITSLARMQYSWDERFSSELAAILEKVTKTGKGRIFQETSRFMTQKLVDMVWIDDSQKVNYLLPLVKHASKNGQTIVTLNYDNAIELAAATLSLPAVTGIESWSKTGQFPETVDGISLLKLHGSIDWCYRNGELNTEKPLPYQQLEQAEHEYMKGPDYQPALIFGQRNKLTAKGPFLDLLRSFKEKLQATDLLTVIGYSFGDDHVNEFVGQWINSAPYRRIRVLNGANFTTDSTPFVRMVHRYARDRIDIIPKYAREGVSDCYA